MKLKKNIPLIDQHDKYGFWGGKFGGSYIPETLKKPVEDLTIEFKKLRRNKRFIERRDYYFKNFTFKTKLFSSHTKHFSSIPGTRISNYIFFTHRLTD